MLQEVNELLKVRAQIIELVLSSAVSSRLPTSSRQLLKRAR